MIRSISAVLLTGTLALAGAACDVHVGDNGVSLDVGGDKATSEWTHRYPVAKGATLEVINTNGTIEVDAAGGSDIEVMATITIRAGNEDEAQKLVKQVVIKEEVVSTSHVRLKTTVADGSATLFGRRSANVEYHLKVPAGLTVNVRTENGGVTIENVSGNLTASTTNGGVRGSNVSGAVSMHTVNGGIILNVSQVTGPIMAEVVNGGIRLDLPENVKADLDASAVNGGVSVEGLTMTTTQQSRTKVAGQINGGGAKISAITVNGGVRIGVQHARLNSTN